MLKTYNKQENNASTISMGVVNITFALKRYSKRNLSIDCEHHVFRKLQAEQQNHKSQWQKHTLPTRVGGSILHDDARMIPLEQTAGVSCRWLEPIREVESNNLVKNLGSEQTEAAAGKSDSSLSMLTRQIIRIIKSEWILSQGRYQRGTKGGGGDARSQSAGPGSVQDLSRWASSSLSTVVHLNVSFYDTLIWSVKFFFSQVILKFNPIIVLFVLSCC